MPRHKVLPSQGELLKLFRYDEETGKLFNRVGRGPRAKAGDEAGSIQRCDSNAYRIIKLSRQKLKAHRIIWVMQNGSLAEDAEIDHIDRDGLNNVYKNLRLVTRAQNARNLPLMKSNTSGYTGVARRNSKWIARIVVGGKRRHLGTFEDKESAIVARQKAEAHYAEAA